MTKWYVEDGICGEEKSSTAEILGSLSEAISGYIPIVSMLGDEEKVQELDRTIQALTKAKVISCLMLDITDFLSLQDDIKTLESQTGARLPGVSCGASFNEMAAALDGLADFVRIVQNKQV